MSNLVPHVPNPDFWTRYYLAQARGKSYARATPDHRGIAQKGRGTPKVSTVPLKVISPVEQVYEQARSQIKRKRTEVGVVEKGIKRRKKQKSVSRGANIRESKTSKKKKKKNNSKTKGKKSKKKRDIFSSK
jgi:hypothetical protein